MSGRAMQTYVRPDGCRLAYETHGDSSHPALLLLEGMGGDIPGWGRDIEALSASCHLVVYDHRGNGWSDAPDESQSMETFVDDALGLLDHLGIPTAHIYGQSFGGMVAAELALAKPERVMTLILAATHAGGDAVVPSRAKVPKDEADTAIFSVAFVREHPHDVAALYRAGVPQKPAGGRRQWEAMQGYAVGHRLSELTMPVLVLHGDQDRVVDVANAKVLARGIPGAELVILTGAGHVYQWEQPEQADAAVLDFIRRRGAESGAVNKDVSGEGR